MNIKQALINYELINKGCTLQSSELYETIICLGERFNAITRALEDTIDNSQLTLEFIVRKRLSNRSNSATLKPMTNTPTPLDSLLDDPSWDHNDSLAMITHHLQKLVDNGFDTDVAGEILSKLPARMETPTIS